MASVQPGGPLFYLLLLLRSPQQQQQQQHLIACHWNTRYLQPAAAIPAIANTSILLSICHLKGATYSASDRLTGASHATASVLTPVSTTTHTKVNVAATSGQKMSPVWANFTKFQPAVPSGLSQARTSNAACVAQTARSVHCTPTTRHEVLDSQRAEALVEAFTLSKNYSSTTTLLCLALPGMH